MELLQKVVPRTLIPEILSSTVYVAEHHYICLYYSTYSYLRGVLSAGLYDRCVFLHENLLREFTAAIQPR